MEWFFGLLFGGAALFVAFILPIITHIRTGRLRDKIDENNYAKNMAIDALLARVGRLEKELKQLQAAPPPVAVLPPVATPPVVATPVVATPVATTPIEVVEAPTASSPPSDTPVVEAPPSDTASPSLPEPSQPSVTPEPPPADLGAAPAAHAANAPPASLEEKIALVWFTRIGALAFLLGIAYFFKFAVDNNWIGPLGRVAIGVVFGAALLGFAERIRATARTIYVNVLCGVGLGTLLFSAYASFAFYHLVPLPIAFAAFTTVVLLGGALAYRYHAEAILVMSLLAGFSTPILLSTGHDNPLGLFGYLLVLTGLNYVVAIRCGFPVALWIGMTGTTILYFGWYEKFFKIHPPPEVTYDDVPLEQLAGAYYPLTTRAIPIAAVTAFFLEWLTVYFTARRRSLDKLRPVWLLVFASLVGHVGYASLLYDKRPALGLILVGLALVFAYLLGRERRSELLLFPMLAGFATLMALVKHHEQEKPLSMVLLLCAWAIIYTRAFTQSSWRLGEPPPRSTLVLLGVTGALFTLGSVVLLGDHHPLSLLLLMIAMSALSASLGVFAAAPALPSLALIGTFFIFVMSNPHRANQETDLRYVGEALAWALIYIAAVAYDLFWKRQPASRARTAMVMLATFAYPILAFHHMASTERILRSASLLVMALCNFGIGAKLLRRSHDERPFATVHLGLALGLFAGTAATLLSGASITLVWAALGATAVVLSLNERDRAWVWGGGVLLLCAAWRAVAIDLEVTDHLLKKFLWSNGKEGQYIVHALFNQRGIGLLFTAIGCLVAAQRINRAKLDLAVFTRWSQGLFVIGHALLLTVLVKEVHQAFLSLPPLPAGLAGSDEFGAFAESVRALTDEARLRNAMLTTLIMGLYATVVVLIGFGLRNAPSRFIGLGVFALTIAKLALYDVWRLEKVFQILVLMGVGGLLLGASFLYARYGKRLVEILKQGTGPTVVLLLALSGVANADADPTKFLQQQSLTATTDGSFYAVETTPELLRASKGTCSLCDVRVVGPKGEVPYFFIDAPLTTERPFDRAVTMLSPTTNADGSSVAVFDLGENNPRHDELRLDLGGSNFLRRVKVEISPDGKKYARLTQYSRVYRVSDGASTSADTHIHYPLTEQRYVRVTIEGKPGEAPVAIRGASLHIAPAGTMPWRTEVSAVATPGPAEKSPPKTSVWMVDLGDPGVPFDELVLDIAESGFDRRATLSAATHGTYWARLAESHIYNIEQEQQLSIHFTPTNKKTLKLEIYDGDSAPLTIRAVKLRFSPRQLVFAATQGAGAYTLYVGAEGTGAPDYDFERVTRSKPPASVVLLPPVPVAANPLWKAPAPPADDRPFTEKNQTVLAIAIGAIVALLALYTVMLLRKKPPQPPQA